VSTAAASLAAQLATATVSVLDDSGDTIAA
jgi:hypothetical protein